MYFSFFLTQICSYIFCRLIDLEHLTFYVLKVFSLNLILFNYSLI